MEQAKPNISTLQAWLLAIRLPTLLIPTIQVWTGVGVAYAILGHINWLLALYAWVVAVAITVGTNLINDAVDFERGGDPVNRFGKIKVIPAGLLTKDQVYMAGYIAFGIACAVPFALDVDALLCFIIVFISCLCGYGYTAGPFPISYLGLSEVFIFIFYGGVCVTVPYYAQTYSISSEILLAATQMGMLAILPNALNNFRDIKEDAAVNKRTLAVRFGKKFACDEITVLTLLPFILNLGWLFLGHAEAALMPLLISPLAYFFVKTIRHHNQGQSLNKYFGLSVVIHFMFGLFLITGILIG